MRIVQILKASKAALRIGVDEQEHTGTSRRLLSGLDAIRPQGSLCVSMVYGMPVFASVASSGCGLRSITGSTDPFFLDAAQIAITWASLHAGWLRARGAALSRGGKVERNGVLSRSGLHRRDEDVVLSFMAPHLIRKTGASAGSCAALALAQWLVRPLTTRGVVSVTGPISLRGYLLKAEGIVEKAGCAQRAGADMLIMSDDTYDQVGVTRMCVWGRPLKVLSWFDARPERACLQSAAGHRRVSAPVGSLCLLWWSEVS